VNRIERYLDQLIGGLNDMVERALQKHRLNPKTLDSNESTRKTDANWHQALEPGISIWGEQAIPPCPICGVNPHNWGIHEEWRRLPGAKSKERLADQLYESVLSLSDEVILAESEADAEKEAERTRTILKQGLQKLENVSRRLSSLGHTVNANG
jgi:hypothetical protein